jgi:hypothetical protein
LRCDQANNSSLPVADAAINPVPTLSQIQFCTVPSNPPLPLAALQNRNADVEVICCMRGGFAVLLLPIKPSGHINGRRVFFDVAFQQLTPA